MSNQNEDKGTHRVYVILGTCHDLQWRGGAPPQSVLKKIDSLASLIRDLLRKHKIALIAEEAPERFGHLLVVPEIAKDEGICYLDVDMHIQDLRFAGIDEEVRNRYGAGLEERPNTEVRLCRADDMRENFWLDMIERTKASPALVVCGWAHTRFLAGKVTARRNVVAEEIYFPPQLREAKIEIRP